MLRRLAAVALVALVTLPGTATAMEIWPRACVYVGNPSSIKDTHVSTSESCGPGMRTASVQVDDHGLKACTREARNNDCVHLVVEYRTYSGERDPDVDGSDLLP